jgi:hypothetical protein
LISKIDLANHVNTWVRNQGEFKNDRKNKNNDKGEFKMIENMKASFPIESNAPP